MGPPWRERQSPDGFRWRPTNLVTTTLEALKGPGLPRAADQVAGAHQDGRRAGAHPSGLHGHQVKLALGDPLRKSLRRSADDVAEEWTYSDRRIVFSHTGVATIESLDP